MSMPVFRGVSLKNKAYLVKLDKPYASGYVYVNACFIYITYI